MQNPSELHVGANSTISAYRCASIRLRREAHLSRNALHHREVEQLVASLEPRLCSPPLGRLLLASRSAAVEHSALAWWRVLYGCTRLDRAGAGFVLLPLSFFLPPSLRSKLAFAKTGLNYKTVMLFGSPFIAIHDGLRTGAFLLSVG